MTSNKKFYEREFYEYLTRGYTLKPVGKDVEIYLNNKLIMVYRNVLEEGE